MTRIVRDIKSLLLEDGHAFTDEDLHELWDDELGNVPGGINWASDCADSLNEQAFIAVSGPPVDDEKVDF
ncbi:hypothetical protein Sar04_47980 [Salinispora arenicola]|uniref:Uncharacterized protein n=1 Tax=Salinispora arenicola TaxID=168697 RepID=A0ABQ4JYR6_SALAC|nr:hypothetical protein [Salinispora arenicola]GIM88062.1 hypothetical protein Sar04_47980 [Salinispora arenicola]